MFYCNLMKNITFCVKKIDISTIEPKLAMKSHKKDKYV